LAGEDGAPLVAAAAANLFVSSADLPVGMDSTRNPVNGARGDMDNKQRSTSLTIRNRDCNNDQ
jgi:hypothetical protein